MTVDWVAGNIYYLDVERDVIGVVNLDGNYAVTLGVQNLIDAYGLVVDPFGKYV